MCHNYYVLANIDLTTTENIIHWCMIYWNYLVAILVCLALLILAIALYCTGYIILQTVAATIVVTFVIILFSILHLLFPNVVPQSIVDVSICLLYTV